MKQKLLFLLVLLLTATTGAWAQSAFTAKEITSASQLTSTDDEAYVAACMPSDFLPVGEDVAKAWTGAPDGSAILIYAINGDKIKMATFFNGSNKDTTGATWSIAFFKSQLTNSRFFYIAASYSVTLAEGTEDAGKWTIDPTEAAEGSPVTATYSGEKKVKSVKAVKKKSASKLASEVTTEDIFKVIASDGMIYDNIAAAESAGTVAQGLVVYVGSNTGHNTYTHGMALALKDESDNTWSGAKDACNAKNTSTPIVGALWIQASKDQWNTMFNAVGNDSKLRDCFSSAGGTNLVKFGNYWSGSSHEDYGEQGDFYMFSEDDWPGDWGSTSVYYNDNYHVRACIVF